MRVLLLALASAPLLAGCFLVDGLVGAQLASIDDVCARVVERHEACDQGGIDEAQCRDVVECLRSEAPEECEGQWRDYLRCVYSTEDVCPAVAPGPFDAWAQGPCSGELRGYADCLVEQLGAEHLAGCMGGAIGCDPSAGTCPCSSDLDCGFGATCDVDAGVCVVSRLGCVDDGDCPDGAVCASPADNCNELRLGSPDDCDRLPSDEACHARCELNGECAGGEHCWLLVDDGGATDRLGFCAPGNCGIASCAAGECGGGDNGPGSGWCSSSCDPGCVPEGCGQCSGGAHCQPVGVDVDDVSSYACVEAGGIAEGEPCGDRPLDCALGLVCSTRDGDEPRCLRPCLPGTTTCPGPEPECWPSDLPDVGVCLAGASVVTCAGGAGCGEGAVCADLYGACEGDRSSAAPAFESCEWASGAPEECRPACDPSDPTTCGSGERCYVWAGGAFCGPGQCGATADCAISQACVDVGNGDWSGVCRTTCDATACNPSGCEPCPDPLSSCLLLPASGALELVCATPNEDALEGAVCQVGVDACAVGLACLDVGDGGRCMPLCDPGLLCEGGAECIEFAVTFAWGPPGGFCLVEGSSGVCSDASECGGGLCTSLDALCASEAGANPYGSGCSWSSGDQCHFTCGSGDSAPFGCGFGERCYPDGTGGWGLCGPGQCADDGACTGLLDTCVDEARLDIGLCARACVPGNCDAAGCPECVAGQVCTGVRHADEESTLAFVCTDPRGGVGLGGQCELGEPNGCPLRTLCARDTDGKTRCLEVCPGGNCEFGGQCVDLDVSPYGFFGTAQQVCRSPPGATPLGQSCTIDDDCETRVCADVDSLCQQNQLVVETDGACTSPPANAQGSLCRTPCSRDEQCGPIDTCHRRTDGVGFCAPPRCTSDAECTAAGSICVDGICGHECDPASCFEGGSCECTSAETCTTLTEIFPMEVDRFVCREQGARHVLEACDDTSECGAGALCLGALGFARCTPLCSTTSDCPAGYPWMSCTNPNGTALGACEL